MKEKRDKKERERQDLRDKEYLDKKYAILEIESTDESSEDDGRKASVTHSVENWLNKMDFESKNHHQAENTFVKHTHLAHSPFMPPSTASNIMPPAENQLEKRVDNYTGTKPKQFDFKSSAESQPPQTKTNALQLPTTCSNKTMPTSNSNNYLREPAIQDKPNVSKSWLGANYSGKVALLSQNLNCAHTT